MTDTKKVKFYQRTWFLWVMLIFIPPVGIAMLWIQQKYGKRARIVLSVVFGILFMFSVVGGNSGDDDNKEMAEIETIEENIDSSKPEEVATDIELVETIEKIDEVKEEVVEEVVELTKEEKFESELTEYLSDAKGELISIDWEGDYGDGEKYIIIDLKSKNDEEEVAVHVSKIILMLNEYKFNQKSDIVVKDISGDVSSNLSIISLDEERNISVEFESPLYNTVYNQWVESQFSLWDGAHKVLEELIIDSLNDEKSYKHIETRYRVIKTEEDVTEINALFSESGYSQTVKINDLYVITEFSAKNAFNATIKNTAVGVVSYEDNYVTLVDIVY